MNKDEGTAVANLIIFIFVAGIISFSGFIGWHASKLFNQSYLPETPSIVVPEIEYENFQGKG